MRDRMYLVGAAAVTAAALVFRADPPVGWRPPPVDPASRPVAGAPLAGALLFGGTVDLNAATVADLRALPGIGPARAERIVAERDRRGGFASVDDLATVPGIGEATLAAAAPYLRIGPRRRRS